MKWLLALCALLVSSTTIGGDQPPRDDPAPDQYLFVITLDGFRWQELYGGADADLINDPKWTADTAFTKALYWDDDAEKRRARLMPFFWNVIAKKGQLHGNRELGNYVNTRNFYGISYPGYNEIFTGEADLFISTNKKVKNKNRNILEQLNADSSLSGRVAAFASWEVMPFILNRERSGFYLNAGNEAVRDEGIGEGQKALNQILAHPAENDAPTRDDRITFLSAMDYIKRHTPRVLYLGFSGTDDAGHGKSYDRYLRSANEADRMIGELWSYVQSNPTYRDKTTFLITTDHGRGSSDAKWYNHGFLVPGSSQTWMALLGNTVRPMGECRDQQLYQKQIAGTIARIMGLHRGRDNSLPLVLFKAPAKEAELAAR